MNIPARRFTLGFCLSSTALAVVLVALVPGGPATSDAQGPGAKSLKLAGRVEAYEQTSIHARVLGHIKTVDVDIGDRVKSGQVLTEQAVPHLEADLAQKKALAQQAECQVLHAELLLKETRATLAAAAAHVKETEAGVRLAQAKLDEAKAAHERFKKLFDDKVVDPRVVEERAAAVEVVKATLEEAKFHVKTAQATYEGGKNSVLASEIAIKSASAQHQAAQAAAVSAAAMLAYAKITAPFDGVITQRGVHTGALVGPTAARNEPLFSVARVDRVRVVVAIPEKADRPLVQPGAKAIVQYGAQEWKGTVTRMAGAFEPQTGTMRAEIELPNPDGKLLPGRTVQVALE